MSEAGPSAEVLAAARAAPETGPSQDKLERMTEMVAKVRDLEDRKRDLEEQLKATNIELTSYYFKLLPDLFDETGIERITLPADGNHPPVEAKASPFYKANIAADWPEDQRVAGFRYLEDQGAGDLIKTLIVLPFNREDHAAAKEFAAQLRKQGYTPQVSESVMWNTLTSWLKDRVENHKQIPDLEKIGGTVGRVVRLKDVG